MRYLLVAQLRFERLPLLLLLLLLSIAGIGRASCLLSLGERFVGLDTRRIVLSAVWISPRLKCNLPWNRFARERFLLPPPVFSLALILTIAVLLRLRLLLRLLRRFGFGGCARTRRGSFPGRNAIHSLTVGSTLRRARSGRRRGRYRRHSIRAVFRLHFLGE